MKAHNKFFMDCHVAGRKYHDADMVWDQLRVGTLVRLEREKDNPYDPEAVQVVFNNDGEDYLLGYIPRGENHYLSLLFDVGRGDIFECRINRIIPEAHTEQQIHLTISLKQNEEASVSTDVFNQTDLICPEEEKNNNRLNSTKNNKK